MTWNLWTWSPWTRNPWTWNLWRGLALLAGVVVWIGLAGLAPVQATNRVALVIGNGAYRAVPKLQNTVNDAKAVAASLRALGFETVETIDADRAVMVEAIAGFIDKIQGGAEAVVFYAGHGIEINGANYMLPVDIRQLQAGQERQLRDNAVSLSNLLQDIEERKARVALLILDACRDNPFPKQGTRSLGSTRGLARPEPPEGVFIMYSAGPGQLALDNLGPGDTNPNGLYTRQLLSLIKQEGLEITELAKRLRVDIDTQAQTLKHKQTPGYYDGLKGQFYFRPAPAVAAAPVVAAAATARVPASASQVAATSPDARSVAIDDLWKKLPFASDPAREKARSDYLAISATKIMAMTSQGNHVRMTGMNSGTSEAENRRIVLERCEFWFSAPCFIAAIGNNVEKPGPSGYQPASVLGVVNGSLARIDRDRAPLLDARRRAAFQVYVTARSPKAAAFHPWFGAFKWVGATTSEAAQKQALAECAADMPKGYVADSSVSVAPCFLYAVDDEIVLHRRATAPL